MKKYRPGLGEESGVADEGGKGAYDQESFAQSEPRRMANIRHHLEKISLSDLADPRVLGLALSMAWSLVTFFSPTIHFSTRNDVSHFNSVVGWSSVGEIAMLLIGALLTRSFLKLMGKSGLVRYAAPVVMAVCTFVLVLVEQDYFEQPWCSIVSAAAGLGLGVLYLACGSALSGASAVRSVVRLFAAVLLSSVLFALVILLPKPLAITVTMILPLASGYVLFRRLRVWQHGEEDLPETPLRKGVFSIRLALSIGIMAFAEAVIQALMMNAVPIIGDGTYPWIHLVGTLVAVALLGISLFSSRQLDFATMYKVNTFALGFLFLLLPIVQLGSIPADFFALAANMLLTVIVWIMLLRMTERYRLPSAFVFGMGLAVFQAGSLAGLFLGAVISSFVEVTSWLLSIIALACACLLFSAYLCLLTERSMGKLLGGAAEGRPKRFRARCDQVAEAYDLTPREKEIMILVAKGRSTPRIQETLGITAGTVNSHLSRLYRKLDIHDKQELIDLIEKGG